jgi:hypothetical protein
LAGNGRVFAHRNSHERRERGSMKSIDSPAGANFGNFPLWCRRPACILGAADIRSIAAFFGPDSVFACGSPYDLDGGSGDQAVFCHQDLCDSASFTGP